MVAQGAGASELVSEFLRKGIYNPSLNTVPYNLKETSVPSFSLVKEELDRVSNIPTFPGLSKELASFFRALTRCNIS